MGGSRQVAFGSSAARARENGHGRGQASLSVIVEKIKCFVHLPTQTTITPHHNCSTYTCICTSFLSGTALKVSKIRGASSGGKENENSDQGICPGNGLTKSWELQCLKAAGVGECARSMPQPRPPLFGVFQSLLFVGASMVRRKGESSSPRPKTVQAVKRYTQIEFQACLLSLRFNWRQSLMNLARSTI